MPDVGRARRPGVRRGIGTSDTLWLGNSRERLRETRRASRSGGTIQTYHEPKLIRDPQVLIVQRPRDAVLIDVRHGRRLSLNSVSAGVWAALAAEPTLAALVESLWSRYDVRAEVLAHEVAVTLATWLDAGLVAWR